MKTFFPTKEAARLAGVSAGRLRRWVNLGLVPASRRPRCRFVFTFKGVVAGRTLKGLREQGVPLGQVRQCLERLRRARPDLTEPLSEVRFLAHPRGLILAQNRRRFTPEGQLLLDFTGESGGVAPLGGREGQHLFLSALALEQGGDRTAAAAAFTAFLESSRDGPDVLVNLGNLLYRFEYLVGAEIHYRRALAADPDHPEAHYNLANLLDEEGRLQEALEHYRQAVQADPEFADAYFNLALTLEKFGDAAGARECWQRYVDLEPAGELAALLKKRLEEEE